MLGQLVWAANNIGQSAIIGQLQATAITAASITGMFDRLLWMGTWGIAAATGVMVGKAIGAGEYARVRQYAKTMQVVFLAIGLGSAVLVYFGHRIFLSFYVLSPDAYQMTQQFMLVLAVAIISRFTEGYFWGVFSSLFGVICVNFVFTYPFWAFNFRLTGYPLTFLTMLAVSLIISAMNTKIKKQERLRTEAERETMRANLLRAMSHDIRTPLTSIVGNTSAILENGDTLSTEQQRELLRDVNEDAQWLIRMVENLLSITRISGEQTAISKEYEAAEEILAASVHKFEKRFKSNIRIAVEVPREVVLVPMDATLIQQVLLNLMENAVLHGESTTELRLSVEHIGDEACFTVSDNGLGIPRERLATLFDGSLSGEKGGGFDMKKNMGIGLSVCQTIVKAHGGRITAENRPEGGAQFRFYLPLKEEKEDEDQG